MGVATHSSILAWRIPWTEEPGGLQSMGSQRVRHDTAPTTTTITSCVWDGSCPQANPWSPRLQPPQLTPWGSSSLITGLQPQFPVFTSILCWAGSQDWTQSSWLKLWPFLLVSANFVSGFSTLIHMYFSGPRLWSAGCQELLFPRMPHSSRYPQTRPLPLMLDPSWTWIPSNCTWIHTKTLNLNC